MNLGSLRRWMPLIVLAVVAIAAWQTAEIADTDDLSEDAVIYDRALSTPVLSARRIPETLRAPVIDDAVAPAVDRLATVSLPYQSCLVAEVDDRVLGSTNPDLALIPASNQKILTTFAGLVQFGPDERFRTTLRTDGPIVDGVLDGNLYLVGGGDPFLSTDEWWTQFEEGDARFHTRIEDVAQVVVDAGITQINGSVIGDDSLFDNVRIGPWADRLIQQNQSGPLSALSVNEGHTAWPAEFSSAAARTQTDDPARHAASVLASILNAGGVSTGGLDTGLTPATALELGTVTSPPLIDLIAHINSYSNNYGAEVLLKHIGRANDGRATTAGGAEAVASILAAQGFDLTNVIIQDGSGLAETNRLNCRLLADVLDAAGSESAYADSFSIVGERGSLRNRLDETAADGQVFAKTGTLNTVTALSGYVDSPTEPGTTIIFSYIANGDAAGVGAGINTELVGAQLPFLLDLAAYPTGPTLDDLDPTPTRPS